MNGTHGVMGFFFLKRACIFYKSQLFHKDFPCRYGNSVCSKTDNEATLFGDLLVYLFLVFHCPKAGRLDCPSFAHSSNVNNFAAMLTIVS